MGDKCASVLLPRRVVLQSQYNSKYLSYINDNTEVHGLLQFSGEQVVSIYTKYEVEPAKRSANKGLVHIRCGYNNKYWRRRSADSLWIGAFADESNENHCDWSCTLFEALYVNGQDAAQGVRLRCVQNKHYACLWRAAEPYSSCLFAGSKSPDKDSCDVYTLIDWEMGEMGDKRASVLLPRSVVLQSQYNSKYLSYINDNTEVHGLLQFSGEQVVSIYAKYEVEPAKRSANKGLVHIRCGYNNKYWRRRSEDSLWIGAFADESNENHCDWSCTLFEALYVNGQDAAQGVRLRCVQNKHYACLWRAAEPYSSCLFAGSKSPDKDSCDVYTIIDWEMGEMGDKRASVLLPRSVVLQSQYNSKYLSYINDNTEVHGLLQFSGEKVVSIYAKYEVEPAKRSANKGLVHIRCGYNNKYWRRRSEDSLWIGAFADESNENHCDWSCTLFEALYVNGQDAAQGVRLRCVQNKHYACLWRAAKPYSSCLFAGSKSPDKDWCDVYTIIDWEMGEMGDKYASVLLPRRVVLQSQYNSKYLSYINANTPPLHGFLRFSGEQVVSIYAKYEVEPTKTSANKGLVHLRCSYNNKYWRRQSKNSFWIGAFGDESNENHSDWSCTLFKPVYVNGQDVTQGIRLRSVQSKRYACLWRAAEPYSSCLYAGSESPDKDNCDVYTIIDWENFVVLPKHIAFKGNHGKYLTAAFQEGHEYLQFSSRDIGTPGVGNEVFITNNGSVIIKSDYYGKFWRCSPNWIWADTNLNIITDPSSIDNTKISNDLLFMPIRLGENEVALKNLGNNYFCKRLTTKGKKSCLNAGVSTISKEARLEVSETVVSRDIYNVDYHLLDSRIYNQTVITLATGVAVNGSNEPITVDLKLSYIDTKTNTWNISTVSLKLGTKMTFEARTPLIVESKVELSGESTRTYSWGETKTAIQTVEITYKVTVPAKTRSRVSLLATQGSCDVPFSYTQRDTLNNGKPVTYNMDDGVYNGVNYYNFEYGTKEEPL